MNLSNDQWKSVEKSLLPPFGCSKLKIDGYIVDLVVTMSSNRLRFNIMIYINGKIKPSWVLEKTPEAENIRKRFFRPSKICGYRSTKCNIKKYGKRFVDDMKKKYSGIIYLPYWNSFSALKKHLVANNKNIELIC